MHMFILCQDDGMDTFIARLLSQWDLLLVTALSNKAKWIMSNLFLRVNLFVSTWIFTPIVCIHGLPSIKGDDSLHLCSKHKYILFKYCLNYANFYIYFWIGHVICRVTIYLFSPFFFPLFLLPSLLGWLTQDNLLCPCQALLYWFYPFQLPLYPLKVWLVNYPLRFPQHDIGSFYFIFHEGKFWKYLFHAHLCCSQVVLFVLQDF